jgi:hypothetical protein
MKFNSSHSIQNSISGHQLSIFPGKGKVARA